MTSFILNSPAVRANAVRAVQEAEEGMIVSLSKPTRSNVQNNMLHALFSDMAKSGFKWDGEARDAGEWKALCVSGHTIATGLPAKFSRGLEGELLNTREQTSKMGVARAASLITYVLAFCDTNSIPLTETKAGGFDELMNRIGG